MTDRGFTRQTVMALAIAVPVITQADSNALLVRMQQASRSLDFDGVFVYQRGDQLDSLRIVHKGGESGVRERLVALNGPPREIVRDTKETRCYLSDDQGVFLEHRRAEGRAFPALLPDSIANLKESYRLQVGKESRVAGRQARQVVIKPRDSLRYGYQLWSDKTTGLLLKAGLLDGEGRLLEQYMFTQINIGQPIREQDLKPQSPRGKRIRGSENPVAAEPGLAKWAVSDLPPGFRLTARLSRAVKHERSEMEHLVYSDGLAMVSVFIEPQSDGDESDSLAGVTRMGAIHVYGRQIDGHRVTVMGEVPEMTVSMIGDSVRRIQ